MTALAPILQSYFTERLIQRRASQHTVASYRDCFCLLLRFAQQRTGKAPSALDLGDIDAPLVGAFLDYLERDRGNSLATRNTRLAALHSLFRHAALRCPEHAQTIQRVLAIPPKRADSTLVSFLTHTEIQALLASPDRATWLGRRDHALLLTAAQTGLRVSELTALTRGDVDLGTGANLRCHGKGRKQRITPLTRQTARVLRAWLAERDGQPTDPLFPSRNSGRLSRDAVADLVAKHAAIATQHSPTLRDKHVTPHVLRHSTAMALLHAGTDTSVIALWLGHTGTKATQVYLHADLALKEKALAHTAPLPAHATRYRPPDTLLSFLENL